MSICLPPLSLYIHIPWCLQKCPYCDFNSHSLKTTLPETDYVDKLLADLAADIETFKIQRPLTSIFIGGGTPSLFSATALETLLKGVKKQLDWDQEIEITLEANPSTFEADKFAAYRNLGINRLSIGIQSFNDQHLRSLGRVHCAKEALTAIEIAQQVGFDNLNLDLMFGLPEQTEAESLADIKQALAFQPTHLSMYQLTLEPNTYFYRHPPVLPSDDLMFTMQQQNQALLAEQDYQQYEISAYSRQSKQCQHNLNYWQFGDYLGIGAGAHGKITQQPDSIFRTLKPKHPQAYLSAQKTLPTTIIPTQELPLEFLINQLRLKQGFTLAHYQQVTGLKSAILQHKLADAVNSGLLVQQQQHYFCSEKGWLFLDDILQQFIC